jgi:hypothetical protein
MLFIFQQLFSTSVIIFGITQKFCCILKFEIQYFISFIIKFLKNKKTLGLLFYSQEFVNYDFILFHQKPLLGLA